MAKRLSRKVGRWIIVGALVAWIVLMVIGFFVAYSLADKNKAIAGLVGIVLGGAVWVVLCWTFGLTARVMLQRRGYDVSPQSKRTGGS